MAQGGLRAHRRRCRQSPWPLWSRTPVRRARALALDRRGQSTVEYLLVTLAFLVPTLVLAVVWRKASGGGLMHKVLESVSHGLAPGGLLAALQDVLLY